RATYDTDIMFANSSNSSADDDGQFTAKSGDRITSIPAHQLKLRGQYQVTPAWSIGANVIGYSDQYVMGNENNKHRANSANCDDGEECATGKGKLSGYFLVNLDTQYTIGNGWQAFAKLTNIFDKEYDVSGRLAETLFDSNGVFDEEQKMLGILPGAPR